MSEVDFTVVKQTNINLPSSIYHEMKGGIRGFVPRNPIPWSRTLQEGLIAFFTKVDYPFRQVEDIPFKDPLRSEIRRFFISLDAYIESSHPVIPYKDILYGAADIKYAEYLKRVKRKSFETTWGANNFSYPDWWNDVPSYYIFDIGDIFNYSYLIFFDDEVEDYKEGFEKVSIKPSYLSNFKETLRGLLPERTKFNKIDPLEVLSEISSSMSINESFDSKPHYLIKDKYLYFSKKRKVCKRSVIAVSPKNIRDTVINDPSDLNTIVLIDRQMLEILSKMKGHIHLSNRFKVHSRLKKLKSKFTYFLHRDIKKEGITKPRELLKAMLEVLHDLYPDIEIFSYTDFYDEYQVKINDEIISPPRGHGLGMANALTTLMQLCIHEMILEKCREDGSFIESKMLCINDDFVAGFNSEEDIETYWEMEDQVLSKLSILREPTKSFYAKGHFVLAEKYFVYHGEYDKESYLRREALYPLACYNISHAKEYFISAQTYVSYEFCAKYISEIISYWGYELYPNEFQYPSIFGGWINEKIEGIDFSLLLLEKLPFKSYVSKGFFAAKIHGQNLPKGKKLFTPPLVKLLGYPEIPEEFRAQFDYLPVFTIMQKYGKLLKFSTDAFKEHWDKLYKDRVEMFKKSQPISIEELTHKAVKHYDSTQFFPNELMISKFHQGKEVNVKIDDPYIDPNAKIACLAKFNELDYPFKECFSIRFTNIDEHTQRTSGLYSKEVQKSLKSEITDSVRIYEVNNIYWPTDDYDPNTQYINPIKIGVFATQYYGNLGYPELREEFVNPLVKEKKNIYNYFFSLEELEMITRCGFSREYLKKLLDLSFKFKISLLDLVELLKENYQDLTEIAAAPEKKELVISDPYTITVDDLMQEGIPKFYNYRNQRELFSFESNEVREACEIIALCISQLELGSAMGRNITDSDLEWVILNLNRSKLADNVFIREKIVDFFLGQNKTSSSDPEPDLVVDFGEDW